MEYTTLGGTGTQVSRICLGCMSFGDSSWRDWVRGEGFGHDLVERALELGVNFFDTANVYSYGESERILGEALEGHREEAVVATKVFFRMDQDDPLTGGLSRKTIEQELDDSLDRLGMDTVDLYQIHRRDRHTPPVVTMRALDDAVRRGQVRHLGASSMWAHQFAAYQHAAEREGLEQFATMQNHYNVMYREEEREMLPYCDRGDVGVIPWSPLARGLAARPHEAVGATERGQTDHDERQQRYLEKGGREINERLQELADQEGVTMAQIALAWLLDQPAVDAPIVGTTSVEHLEDAVEATELSLSDSDLAYLEDPYDPKEISGH